MLKIWQGSYTEKTGQAEVFQTDVSELKQDQHHMAWVKCNKKEQTMNEMHKINAFVFQNDAASEHKNANLLNSTILQCPAYPLPTHNLV